jgi:hypothetical protein
LKQISKTDPWELADPLNVRGVVGNGMAVANWGDVLASYRW